MHLKVGVADGARTHDNRNHNPGLYQLSLDLVGLSRYFVPVCPTQKDIKRTRICPPKLH